MHQLRVTLLVLHLNRIAVAACITTCTVNFNFEATPTAGIGYGLIRKAINRVSL